jgi:hypothetical protein
MLPMLCLFELEMVSQAVQTCQDQVLPCRMQVAYTSRVPPVVKE